MCGYLAQAFSWQARTPPMRFMSVPRYGKWKTKSSTSGRTSRCEGASRRTEHGWHEGAVDGELLRGARFPLPAGQRYVRVEVADGQGRLAWTNPIWLT